MLASLGVLIIVKSLWERPKFTPRRVPGDVNPPGIRQCSGRYSGGIVLRIVRRSGTTSAIDGCTRRQPYSPKTRAISHPANRIAESMPRRSRCAKVRTGWLCTDDAARLATCFVIGECDENT